MCKSFANMKSHVPAAALFLDRYRRQWDDYARMVVKTGKHWRRLCNVSDNPIKCMSRLHNTLYMHACAFKGVLSGCFFAGSRFYYVFLNIPTQENTCLSLHFCKNWIPLLWVCFIAHFRWQFHRGHCMHFCESEMR